MLRTAVKPTRQSIDAWMRKKSTPAPTMTPFAAAQDEDLEKELRRRKALSMSASQPRFKRFGEFARACAKVPGGAVDERLMRAPRGANENDPTSGGWLVPEEFVDDLILSIYSESVLAPLSDHRESSRPASVKLPAIDESSRADGSRSGGAWAYWSSEASQVPFSMPKYRQISFSSKKLIALVETTDELLEDVPALEGHLLSVFGSELGFKLDLAILAGDGAGKPLGVLNSPALIVQPKDVGEASGVVSYTNIIGMWTRLASGCRKNAIWAINQDVEPQLFSMSSTAGSGAVPVYLPANSDTGTGYGTLFGRPVIPLEQSPALSSQGDVALIDPSKYILMDGGQKAALSLDVAFPSDQALWRLVWRIDGMPAYASAVTPYSGGAVRSPYVALAAR